MYGEHRPYGYIYGGSGGAFKTMSCFETCPDVWDGAVPFIHGTPMSMPNQFTVLNHALRLLRGKFPQITDAVEPGGSGDMYAGLNTEEREALVEVTRFGFHPRSWFDVERIAASYSMVWSLLVDNVIKWDPEYFEDFWTVPGYLGYDPPPSLARARLQHPTVVTETVNVGAGARARAPTAVDDERRFVVRRAGGAARGLDPRREPAGRGRSDDERQGRRGSPLHHDPRRRLPRGRVR